MPKTTDAVQLTTPITPPAAPTAPIIDITLPQEEKELLNAYRKAKRLGFADITISIQEGKRVKLWLTEKMR